VKIALFSAHDFERDSFDRANGEFHHDLCYHPQRLEQATASAAAGCPGICASANDALDASTLEALAAGGARAILLRCAGFDRVDLAAAEYSKLVILRVPAYDPEAIAEHATALMLTLNRKIHRAYDRIRTGNFELSGLVGFDMRGKTVGIVGTGKIGRALARIMNGFGCNLLGYDVARSAACEELGLTYVDLPDLLRRSDIVSLHCPLTLATKHLIDAETLALMKPGAMLVNTSRGAVVDAAAVVQALKAGTLGYFAMDVYENESALFGRDLSSTVIPDDLFERLTTFPNALITAHQSWLTDTALAEIARITLGNARDFELGAGKTENRVGGAAA
jgi:D-lactate dehydrogenase